MRILHCGKYYPPHKGGMETFLAHLAGEQAANGDAVLVLAHGTPTDPPAPPDSGPAVWRAPVRLTLGGYAPVAPGVLALYARALVRFRPDIIHVHAPNTAALWPALFHWRRPLVLHWHADVDFPPGRGPSPPLLACWRRLESLILARADAIIVTSRAYLDSSPALAAHRGKCRIIPLGLSSPSCPDAAKHPAPAFLARADGLRVLAVGRLAHYKGFQILCRAVLETPGTSLCLVGEGEQRPVLHALAGLPEAAGRIFLAGETPSAALEACYRNSHVLVLPSISRSEAFGMVLLEAMSHGLACIATAVAGSGMGEVVQAGETGLLVRPGSVAELADALRRLAADPAWCRSLGRAGRKRFDAAGYAMPSVAREIRSLYTALLPPSR